MMKKTDYHRGHGEAQRSLREIHSELLCVLCVLSLWLCGRFEGLRTVSVSDSRIGVIGVIGG
jgi:hypothetical protein